MKKSMDYFLHAFILLIKGKVKNSKNDFFLLSWKLRFKKNPKRKTIFCKFHICTVLKNEAGDLSFLIFICFLRWQSLNIDFSGFNQHGVTLSNRPSEITLINLPVWWAKIKQAEQGGIEKKSWQAKPICPRHAR